MSISDGSVPRERQNPVARVPVLAELMSFLFIGGTAALLFVGLSTLMVDLRTGVPDWLMSALCYALFVGPVYLAHHHVSFRSQAPHLRALPRYLLVQVGGLGLAALFSYLCYGFLGLPTVVAAVTVIALTSGVNFAIVRAWAFAEGR